MKPLNSRRHFLKGSALGIAAAPLLWSQMGNRLDAGIDEASPYSRSSDL